MSKAINQSIKKKWIDKWIKVDKHQLKTHEQWDCEMINFVFKHCKGKVFNAFVKVIPNFYSCKVNAHSQCEESLLCFLSAIELGCDPCFLAEDKIWSGLIGSGLLKCIRHSKAQLAFFLKMNEYHVIWKIHDSTQKNCPHMAHFNVPHDCFETNSQHQKHYSEGCKKNWGCHGLLGKAALPHRNR